MQVVVVKNNKARFNKILETLLYSIGYLLSFYIVSQMFDTFVLSKNYPFLYAVIAVLIIFALNKTVKPILVFLTLPITALTLGAFYFVLNTFILKLVDFIMLDKLDFTNIWILFIISVMISVINLLLELIIIKPIMRRVRINGKSSN